MKILFFAVTSLGFGCALFCSQEVKIPLEDRCIKLPLKNPKWNALLEQLQKSQDLSPLSDAADEALVRRGLNPRTSPPGSRPHRESTHAPCA